MSEPYEMVERVAFAEYSSLEQPERREPLGVFFWICVVWIGLNLIGAIFANVLP